MLKEADCKTIELQEKLGNLGYEINGVKHLAGVRYFFWTYVADEKFTNDYFSRGLISLLKLFSPVILCNDYEMSTKKIFTPSLNLRLLPFLKGFLADDIIELKNLKVKRRRVAFLKLRDVVEAFRLSFKVRSIVLSLNLNFSLRSQIIFAMYLIGLHRSSLRLEFVLKSSKFEKILVHTDNHPEMCTYVEVARKLRIKSFLLQHGYDCEYKILDYLYADIALVWGEDKKNKFLANGVESERIKKIGHPLYAKDRRRSARLKNTNVGKFLFCSRPHRKEKNYFKSRKEDEGVRILSTLLLFAKENNVIINVRFHPYDDREIYKNLLSEYQKNINVLEAQLSNLEDYELIISEDSTIALEVLASVGNLVIAHFSEVPLSLPLKNLESVPVYSNEEDLLKGIYSFYSEVDSRKTPDFLIQDILDSVYGEQTFDVGDIIKG